jgi:hypothetical protein
MKILISLLGEGTCSTEIECTEEQYKFLLMIKDKMGDLEDEDYSPHLWIEELK